MSNLPSTLHGKLKRWVYDSLYGLARLLAYYPFISTLIDSVTGSSGTFTRSTVKTFIHDDGTVDTAAINAPAYTGSGVLLEPAATNIALYSEDMSTGYTVSNFTKTTGQTDPKGGTNAFLMTSTVVVGNSAYIYSATYAHASSQTQYVSYFVKKGTSDYAAIWILNGAGTHYSRITVNIITGTWGTAENVGYAIADKGIDTLTGGWYRIWAKVTTTGASSYAVIGLIAAQDTWVVSGVGHTMYAYQLDIKENLSSPIITTTTALTRTSDVLTVPTTGFKTNDFSYYLKRKITALQANATYVFIEYLDANNSIYVAYNSSTGKYELSVITGGVTRQTSLTYTPTFGVETEFLVKVSPTFIALVIEGSSVVETAAGADMTHAAVVTLYDAGTLFTVPEGSVDSYFKFINTSNITLAQAAAL